MTNQEEKIEEIEVKCPHCRKKFSIWIKAKADSEVKTELQVEKF